MALSLCSVNHISKVVTDVEKSLRFYKEVLGFQEVQRPSSFDFDGCWLWSYNVGIHLIEGKPVERPNEIDPKSDHLSFVAEDLQLVQEQLSKLDIPYVKQIIVEGGVQVEQVFFHDPDGNMLEVCNCNCLPILPVERAAVACRACSLSPAGGQQLDEAVAAAANSGAAMDCCSPHSADSGDEDALGFHPTN